MTKPKWREGPEADVQGGLESVSKAERVASLTGIRAVAALLVMLTHAAYTTGKYTHGYLGLVYSRAEIGVPIFFVLSGFLLFGPWVKGRARSGARRPVGAPLRLAPGATDHARLRRHRAGRPTSSTTSAPQARIPGTRGSACSATSPSPRPTPTTTCIRICTKDLRRCGAWRWRPRSTWCCRCWRICCWWCCADGGGGRACCWPVSAD